MSRLKYLKCIRHTRIYVRCLGTQSPAKLRESLEKQARAMGRVRDALGRYAQGPTPRLNPSRIHVFGTPDASRSKNIYQESRTATWKEQRQICFISRSATIMRLNKDAC